MKRGAKLVSSMAGAGASRASLPRRGRTLLLAAAVSVAASLLFGCDDSGAGSKPKDDLYPATVLSQGTGASGSGNYKAGATVTIFSGTPPAGQQFKNWTTTTSGVVFADSYNPQTTFTMPAKEVTVAAVFGTNIFSVTVLGPGAGSSGSGNYSAGATVTISSGTPPAGQQFKNWTSTPAGLTFADASSPQTTFIMPTNNVTVAAEFGPNTFSVTVVSAGTEASGDGKYATGETVIINCGTPPTGQRFKNWTTATTGVTFGSANNTQTTFVMPPRDVTVTAVFESSIIIDPRDGKTYKTVKISNQTWMAQNLDYETTTGSWCYGNSPDSCKKYGRLYDWNTAKTSTCPTGWHLPSITEWENLINYVGSSGAGTRLKAKSPSWNGTDDYGFSALPGGRRYTDGSVAGAGTESHWWTNTESTVGSGANADTRYITSSGSAISYSNYGKNGGHSVRCLQE